MENDGDLKCGLTQQRVKELQEKYGKNELSTKKKESFLFKTFHIMCEPMFLLLIISSIIYFVLGELRDGIIMLVFVISIIGIEVVQEWKTDKTLNALKDLSAPQIKVIREGKEEIIPSIELVPGDIMIISEGVKIPADGIVIKCSGLCVDESSLTGEAEGIWKIVFSKDLKQEDYWRKDYCYAGTLVTQGIAYIEVDKIGTETEYGKISKNILDAVEEPTPLKKQTDKLVKMCTIIAAILFLLVCIFTYLNIPDHAFKDRIIESILSGITLAMAMIPEEFPVVLTVFLSMGAWRLAKKNSLVKKLPSVETLGAVSVLCTDKTGTITLNQMTVESVWSLQKDNEKEVIKLMGMACEKDTFDSMEKAMIIHCEENYIDKQELFGGEHIKEYPFTNELKMMGHIWKTDNKVFATVKGAPESILNISKIEKTEELVIKEKIEELSSKGMRVIAVGKMELENKDNIPEKITDCIVKFEGLIGLIDPPRISVKKDIEECKKAGIRVVMITGDNGITAKAIARQIGLENFDYIITGEELDNMTDIELREKVKNVNIFSRVIPEHKMRIVKAFKENGEIVAMTGDGVNDASALKYANIGIAMGKRGSEVSREASDLILLDDNFSTIVDTIKDGRRIYDNIQKAIGYIFTIHIPIALASLLAPMLKINPTNLFLLPLQVVLLELVIDPTCSIVLERQPAEEDIMNRKPRKTNSNILNKGTLFKSIIQGLVLFAGSFGTYYYILSQNIENIVVARTMGLAIIVLGNLLLVQVNSSEKESVIESIKKLSKDKVIWFVNVLTIIIMLLLMYSPINSLFKLAPLSIKQLGIVFIISIVSIMWYEIVKLVKKLIK